MEGCVQLPVEEEQLNELVEQAKDYALSHGKWWLLYPRIVIDIND